jgi:CheY-like chemotaxis protein
MPVSEGRLPVTQSLRFLIVEDDVFSAEAMQRLLEREGHQVKVYYDSTTALDVVAEMKPDVALVDIMMPAMDGLELCRRLRQDPKLARTKVVVVTGKTYESDRRRALEMGAQGVIFKPLDPKNFVSDVLTLAA